LYCLHASAYSGQTFEPLMAAMAGRRLVAPDTAGYGASDPPRARWAIPDYANALAETIAAAGDGPVDLLGYHTGAFIATDLAARRPDLVRRLILIGVPYYTGAEREERRATLASPMTLTEDFEQFAERWAFFVTNRAQGQTLARGFENFVDELRAYPNGWLAHEAAFTYEAGARLGAVRQPVLVLNPANHLAAPSRRAAALMPEAQVAELPHLAHAIFDVAPSEIAARIETFLAPGEPAASMAAAGAASMR
jgi:pimeloyl-ACP methyl ester carboxylesterase